MARNSHLKDLKMFKKLALVATLALISSASSAFADNRDFKLVNKTGYEITAIYIGPNHSDEWGPDIMGKKTLDDGEVVDISFDGSPRGCHWDMKVDWADGSKPSQWLDFNLCTIEKITLKYDRNTDVTTAITQ